MGAGVYRRGVAELGYRQGRGGAGAMNGTTIETMLYRRYKTSFSDCETVLGSYDKERKTIDVILPEGRMKPSGVRGQSYHWIEFSGVENATGRPVRCTIKAICRDNAVKRLAKSCTWNI